MTAARAPRQVSYAVLSLVAVDDIVLSDRRPATGYLGGAGSYAAAGLALTSEKAVGVVSGVGADFRAEHMAWFSAWSVDTSALTRRGPRTVRSSLVYRPDQERTETPLVPAATFEAMLPAPADLPEQWRDLAGAYVLRNSAPGFWAALRAALPAGTRVLWEILGSAATADQWPAVAAVLPQADIFSINHAEAARLCGSDDPVRCVSRLLDAGARQVSLRMGHRGALHATPAQWLAVSAAPGRGVVDPTGAGNAHGGALLAAWQESGDLRTAATRAAAAASFAVEQHGPPARTRDIRATVAARAAATQVRQLRTASTGGHTIVHSSTLADQISALPGLIRAASPQLEEATRLVLSTPDHHRLRGVLLCGSGDSQIAGHGAQFAWESLTGIPAQAEDAMTASRYRGARRADSRPLSPLVIALSNSGEAARVVEAAANARARGCQVLAVTADESSRLAKTADTLLLLPPVPSGTVAGPGVANVALMLLALYHLAIRSGEVRGNYPMAEADALRGELAAVAGAAAHTAELAAAPARAIAERWAGATHAEILGSGPSRASAAFCAAKIIEAAGLAAYHQDIEEFLHLNYFSRDTRIATLLISPADSAAHSRAVELARFLQPLGRPVASLSDESLAGLHLPHAPGVREIWHTLLHIGPAALLAAELMRLRGEQPFRGNTGQWADSRGSATVRDSIVEPGTEAS